MDEPSRGDSRVSPARECAYAVVRRVFEGGAWADRALHGEARRLRLDARDRGLATQLGYGTVQRVATLDHIIEALAGRSSSKLDKPVLAALRLGVFQLAYLDRVPAHAAVGEAVELAKRDAPRGAGLVNAVLRRATREARPIVAKLQDTTPKQAALAHSHPEWIAQLWFDALGAPDARALMAADNEPAEAVLRANTLATAPELLERLHLQARPTGGGVDPRRAVRRLRPSSGRTACSCRNPARRWRSRGCSARSPASVCSISARRRAARRPISRP